ncbi:MAG: hypothetical protein IH630_06820 [Thermoplasmata archaeon]|nr:hypothetical protein [Thermoplasmata archaeon]
MCATDQEVPDVMENGLNVSTPDIVPTLYWIYGSSAASTDGAVATNVVNAKSNMHIAIEMDARP